MRRIKLEIAEKSDISTIVTILKDNDLHTEDISDKVENFYIGYDGEDLVGVGGIEVFGKYGLLRSIAIVDGFKGVGYGFHLCDGLFGIAKRLGVEELYLLTLSAPGFFEMVGFERVLRLSAPEEIRGTTEFSELCPDTAVLMKLVV